jgi:hypothetical protein
MSYEKSMVTNFIDVSFSFARVNFRQSRLTSGLKQNNMEVLFAHQM